jgi:hypothetical protein
MDVGGERVHAPKGEGKGERADMVSNEVKGGGAKEWFPCPPSLLASTHCSSVKNVAREGMHAPERRHGRGL